jgi:regulatory protein
MERKPGTIIMEMAGKLLARRAYSRGELREKLAKKSQENSLDPVLDHLEKLNLLNDTEYAYNFALYRIGSEGWSSAKVTAALRRRYVAPSIIETVLERVFEELGETAPLLNYLKKRYGKIGPPRDHEAVNRLVVQLRRRGFDESTIYSALKEIIPPAIIRHLETGD